ncbi:MAG: hypothetical protein ACTTH0_01620 [Eubacteriales bacterium]
MGINKKTAFVFLIASLLLTSACGDSDNSNAANTSDKSKKYASTMQDQSKIISNPDSLKYASATTVKSNIEKIVKNAVAGYTDITSESITVMALQGTDDSDDYTVRCHLSLNNAGVASIAYETISDFTQELANKLDAYSGSVGELSVAWIVPELTGSGRITYKKNDGALEFSTEDFDDNLNVNDNEKDKNNQSE